MTYTLKGCGALLIIVASLSACGSDEPSDSALTIVTPASTTTTPLFIETDATTPDVTEPTTSSDSTAPVDSSVTTPATVPDVTEPADSTTPISITEESPDQQCVTGDWRIRDTEYLEALVRAIDTAGQIDAVEPRGGQFTMTLESDGSFEAQRAAWRFGLGTLQGTLITTIVSTESGTYVINGDTLVIDAPVAPVTVTMQMEEGGTIRDVPADPSLTIGADSLAGADQFTCDGDTLTTSITSAQGGPVLATWDRVRT